MNDGTLSNTPAHCGSPMSAEGGEGEGGGAARGAG